MKVVIGALELDPSKVAGSAKSVPAEHGPQTDRGRLEKLRRWDQRTWTQFFKDYESKIITLCVAMTRDRAIAEDICADTFVRVVSSIDAFREILPSRRGSTPLHAICVSPIWQEPSEQSPSMTKWLMPSRIAPLERNRWWLIGRLTRLCKRQSDSLTHRCEKRFFCVSRETFLMRKSPK